ncbi:MAG: hypothetical protein OEW99_03840, partial [Gammaproteobacteria bacterium]|nr:hypothetical protein [Gammaproteobacteria bacterium]
MKLSKSIPEYHERMMAEMDKDTIDAINLAADKDYVTRTLPGSIVIFLLLIIAGSISDVLIDSPK